MEPVPRDFRRERGEKGHFQKKKKRRGKEKGFCKKRRASRGSSPQRDEKEKERAEAKSGCR